MPALIDVTNNNSIYDKLEPVFSAAHVGVAPVKVDDVARGVKSVLQKEDTVTDIAYYTVPDFKDVSGALERVRSYNSCPTIVHYPKEDKFVANIYYNKTDNYCWERFSKTKELCQIIIGAEVTRISTFNHMKEFIRSLVAPYTRKFCESAVVMATEIDELGILAACEVLFPMRDRHFYIESQDNEEVRRQIIDMVLAQDRFDADDWDGNGPRDDFNDSASFAELLAFAYRIPRHYVEILLGDDTSYAFWRKARDENPARFGDVRPPRRR